MVVLHFLFSVISRDINSSIVPIFLQVTFYFFPQISSYLFIINWNASQSENNPILAKREYSNDKRPISHN